MESPLKPVRMNIQPLKPEDVPWYRRIVADSDIDGLVGAAVLKSFRPEAEVIFTHAAAIRSGKMDEKIHRETVLIDLPFHPQCGWYVDHHVTNKPEPAAALDFEQAGGVQHWQATPSAARLAYELLHQVTSMSHLAAIMPGVDALDSGGISHEDFLADGPLFQFARTCTSTDARYMEHLVALLLTGCSFEEMMQDTWVEQKCQQVVEDRKLALEHVSKHTQIVDRLAICRFDETPLRSNGYLVTAWAGDAIDACCIVHGYADGGLDTPERPPLSASFYANSFIAGGQHRYDLSRLATALDSTGGGHANACGCRIQPPGLVSNLQHWLAMWARREQVLRK